MKKDKHILLNVNEEQYNTLKDIAKKTDRTLTNAVYIIIKKYIDSYLQEDKK